MDAYVAIAGPISGDLVVLTKGLVEMFGMFAAYIFDTKIVHGQDKLDRTCCVAPQTRHQLTLKVSVLVESLFKQLVGQEPGLRKPVHTAGDRDKNHAILIDLVGQFVLANDFVSKVREFDANVLGV